MSDDPKMTFDGPHDRLTEVCDVMVTAAFESGKVSEDAKVIVMVTDGDRCGMNLRGHDGPADAVQDLLQHMEAYMRAIGLKTSILTVPQGTLGGQG